jgi:zinc transport system substrate-binding protein
MAAVTVAAFSLALSSCSSAAEEPSDETLSLVAAFYPLQFIADRVGQDEVSVTSLTQGGEAHDVELSAQQVVEISEADLVLYIKGFQPAVDKAIQQEASDTAMDMAKGLETLTTEDDGQSVPDPHIWLDPQNMVAMADSLKARLTELSPGAGQAFTDQTDRITRHLQTLDEDWQKGTADCESRELVVSHEAFGYLAKRYDLTQVSISGLTPESEPSPARIAEMADLASEEDVTTIFYETSVDPQVARTIADEADVETRVLDPLENAPDAASGDYLSAMLRNLESVGEGLRCS